MRKQPPQQAGDVVTLEVGSRLLGIALHQVQGVLVLGPVTPVPGASGAVVGAVNVGGDVLAVVDLRRLLDGRHIFPLQGERGVQVTLGGSAAVLMGDRLGAVIHAAALPVQPPSPPGALFSAQIATAQGPLFLLQLEALFQELLGPWPGRAAGAQDTQGTTRASSGGQR